MRVPPDLAAVLETALLRRIGELPGLARRAGQAVSGFDKAREWLRPVEAAGATGLRRQRRRAGAVLSGAGEVLVPESATRSGLPMFVATMWCMWRWRRRLGERLTIEAAQIGGLRRTGAIPAGGGKSDFRERR